MCVSCCCLFCVCVQYPGDYVNQISFFNMSMRDPPGRTYKFYTGTPVFEFGHGLSYTTFSFVWWAPPSSGQGLTHKSNVYRFKPWSSCFVVFSLPSWPVVTKWEDMQTWNVLGQVTTYSGTVYTDYQTLGLSFQCQITCFVVWHFFLVTLTSGHVQTWNPSCSSIQHGTYLAVFRNITLPSALSTLTHSTRKIQTYVCRHCVCMIY